MKRLGSPERLRTAFERLHVDNLGPSAPLRRLISPSSVEIHPRKVGGRSSCRRQPPDAAFLPPDAAFFRGLFMWSSVTCRRGSVLGSAGARGSCHPCPVQGRNGRAHFCLSSCNRTRGIPSRSSPREAGRAAGAISYPEWWACPRHVRLLALRTTNRQPFIEAFGPQVPGRVPERRIRSCRCRTEAFLSLPSCCNI